MRAALPTVSLLLMLGLVGPAYADAFEPRSDGWLGYSGDRGTQLAFPPDIFSPGVSQKTESGRSFVAEDAKLEVLAWPNVNGWSVGSLKQELLQKAEYDEVTYSPSGSNWLVMSGFRGDNIFYEKYLFRGGMLHAFSIEFPASAKPFYAPIIEHMEDTFRAASSDETVSRLRQSRQISEEVHSPKRLKGARDPLVVY